MIVLVHSSPTSLVRDHGHPPNLGVLSSPRRVYTDAWDKGYQWAADNDCFQGLDEKAFLKMLDAITGIPGCLFVVAPDAVGDPEETLRLFRKWLYPLRRTGHPVAFVAQDHHDDSWIPWGEFDALFIGGKENTFKLGALAERMVSRAHDNGCWVHMGRVNTRRRVRYAHSIGCDSIDGTNFSMYRRTNLPWALEMCAGGPQGRLVA